MRRILIIAMLWGTVACIGCMHTMNLPPNFVPVNKADMGDYAVRGVSVDGVVVALRSETNPERGTLDFWSQAITNQMTVSQGYKLDSSDDVASASGAPGRLLTFSTEKQGTAFAYLLAVFVQGNDILLAEAGGKADAVQPRLADIRKSLLSAK